MVPRARQDTPHPSAAVRIFLVKKRFEAFRIVGLILNVPSELFRSRVEENGVMNGPVTICAAVGERPFPDNLVLEIVLAENLIEHDPPGLPYADRARGSGGESSEESVPRRLSGVLRGTELRRIMRTLEAA